MKFIHISDLHLGKRVNEFSMLEDQQYILEQIKAAIAEQKPDGVLIAGDIYDKPVPPVEAVNMFDEFLTFICKADVPVYIISGNHDSAERLSFGSELIRKSGVFLAKAFDGGTEKYTLTDKYGNVNIYLLPFVKPVIVRHFYGDENIVTYTDAVKAVIDRMNVDTGERNIIVAHQFVTGAERCKSEEVSVGGLDNVDGSVFAPFDYTALGHIHGPQNVGGNIRYCGSPLKYSFSEENHRKSISVVELLEKGSVRIDTIPLKPLREMKTITDSYENIDNMPPSEDYFRIILTDNARIPNAQNKLGLKFPNIMTLEYLSTFRAAEGEKAPEEDIKSLSPIEILEEFFHKRKGEFMTAEQRKYAEGIIEEIWNGKDGAE